MKHFKKTLAALLLVAVGAIVFDPGPRKGWCVSYGAVATWLCTPKEGTPYTTPR